MKIQNYRIDHWGVCIAFKPNEDRKGFEVERAITMDWIRELPLVIRGTLFGATYGASIFSVIGFLHAMYVAVDEGPSFGDFALDAVGRTGVYGAFGVFVGVIGFNALFIGYALHDGLIRTGCH